MSESTSPDGLAAAVRELEAHAADRGWDQPAALFALVDSAELRVREPELAAALGLDDGAATLTPIEQEELAPGEVLEAVLQTIVWPEAVTGAAAIVERLVLPPTADDDIPDDEGEALEFARQHPEREEVRIVAGVTRDGATYCALRLRAHDEETAVLTGEDLVPELLRLLQGTFDDTEEGADA